MHARHFICAISCYWPIALFSALAPPAAAQQIFNAQTSKAELQPTIADYTQQFKDKGWSKEVIELFFTVKIDRSTYDRVQAKFKHTDQRMILAARDTRDLKLSGRQNFEDISMLTRDEINQLKKHVTAPLKKDGRR